MLNLLLHEMETILPILTRRMLGVLLFAVMTLRALGDSDPVDQVNVIIGTTGPTVNYGGVCPWVTPPYGMTHWTPMTQENSISHLPYRSDQRTLIGFMGTHQPTVWMGDYGFLTLMPETGAREVRTQESGREIIAFTDAAMSALQRYQWPGNVRELENAIERAVVLCRRPQIDAEDLPESILQQPISHAVSASMLSTDIPTSPMPLETALQGPERRIIEAALKRNAWNRQATAAELDINRTTLYKKMRKYQLDIGEVN